MDNSLRAKFVLKFSAVWMVLVVALAFVMVCIVIVLEYQVVVERIFANSDYLPAIQSAARGLRLLRGQ